MSATPLSRSSLSYVSTPFSWRHVAPDGFASRPPSRDSRPNPQSATSPEPRPTPINKLTNPPRTTQAWPPPPALTIMMDRGTVLLTVLALLPPPSALDPGAARHPPPRTVVHLNSWQHQRPPCLAVEPHMFLQHPPTSAPPGAFLGHTVRTSAPHCRRVGRHLVPPWLLRT